jgi:hypothetical protein
MKLHRSDAFSLLAVAFLLGLFTDILARQPIFGLNFLIWSMIWLVLLTVAAADKKQLKLSFWLFGGLALVNAMMVYVRVESVVALWSVVITLTSFGLMAGMLYAPNFMELQLVNRFTQLLVGGTKTIRANARGAAKALDKHKHFDKSFKPSAGIVAALILGVIFILLFASADAAFSHQFSFVGEFFTSVGNWLGQYDLGRLFSMAFWVGFTGAVLLLLLGRDAVVVRVRRHVTFSLSDKDSLIILGTLCIIFALFAVFQLQYLFIGGTLPDNMTYAEYARKGYGQLLVATALASMTVYGALAWTKKEVSGQRHVVLASALVGLNSFIVLSAWKRLSLYEGAYGWTMTRFVARLGLICIFLGSVLLALWIYRRLSTRQLFGHSWYMVAVVLTVAALLNPAGIITAKNITERSQRTEPLDTEYLNQASADSYPALCKYASRIKADYPAEYAALAVPDLRHVEGRGLSAHYTLSQRYKDIVSDCL